MATTTPCGGGSAGLACRVLAIAGGLSLHVSGASTHRTGTSRTHPPIRLWKSLPLVVVWMMLLFTISGASTFYALRNRSGGAFLIVRWAMPDLAKWALIALISLPLYLGLYWFVIRPVNLLRFLFGMKPHGGQPVPYTFANGRHVR
ncbi:hypothetical protein [Candidatus Amarolinea aalborgensis]|uniref:hypothetical protein n=1 Tax=Candidatus Amarolinea aalborgensis TaxID=2249329 RepID=UPI003BF9B300